MRIRLVKQFMDEKLVEAVIQALRNERAVMGESVLLVSYCFGYIVHLLVSV